MEWFAQSSFHMPKCFFPTLRNTLTKAKNFLMKRFIAFFHQKDKNVFFHEIVFARKDAFCTKFTLCSMRYFKEFYLGSVGIKEKWMSRVFGNGKVYPRSE